MWRWDVILVVMEDAQVDVVVHVLLVALILVLGPALVHVREGVPTHVLMAVVEALEGGGNLSDTYSNILANNVFFGEI